MERARRSNPDGDKPPLTVERAAVTSIELSRGSSASRAAGLGLVGGAVGFAGAAAIALFAYGEGSGKEANWLLVLPVAGAAAGVALGNGERWQAVTPTTRVALRPGQPGLSQASLGGVPVARPGRVGMRMTPAPAGIGVSIGVGF